jgi:protein adenylyltransferase
MDRYDPATVFSSIDSRGRYAYGNQPGIAQWNLARFAETLLPLVDADETRAIAHVTDVIEAFSEKYKRHWLTGMRAKLGLFSEDETDFNLAQDLLAAMKNNNVDFTLAFRYLADAASGEEKPIRTLFADPASYDRWSHHWLARLAREDAAPEKRSNAMRSVNPVFIPRNHRVEEALRAAVEDGEYDPFDKLLKVLSRPFEDQPMFADFAEPAPESDERYRTY